MLRIVFQEPTRLKSMQYVVESDPFFDHLRLGVRRYTHLLPFYLLANSIYDRGPIADVQLFSF